MESYFINFSFDFNYFKTGALWQKNCIVHYNFFSSIFLLQELKELSISIIGTIKNNNSDIFRKAFRMPNQWGGYTQGIGLMVVVDLAVA